eukprot:6488672-Amphidinium_carterae.5
MERERHVRQAQQQARPGHHGTFRQLHVRLQAIHQILIENRRQRLSRAAQDRIPPPGHVPRQYRHPVQQGTFEETTLERVQEQADIAEERRLQALRQQYLQDRTAGSATTRSTTRRSTTRCRTNADTRRGTPDRQQHQLQQYIKRQQRGLGLRRLRPYVSQLYMGLLERRNWIHYSRRALQRTLRGVAYKEDKHDLED